MDVVRQIKTIYSNYGFKTQILTAAVRHPLHVLQKPLWLARMYATMSYDVLEQLYHHPMTDLGIEIFLKDWAKVPK